MGWMLAVLVVWSALGTCVHSQAPPMEDEAPPAFDGLFGADLLSLDAPEDDATGAHVQFTGMFQLQEGSRSGRLTLTATMQPGYHVYSTTQPRGGPLPTVIQVLESADYRLTGEFAADRDPSVHEDAAFPGVRLEQFEREVTWTAPLELAESAELESLQIHATVNGQLCEASGSCELIADVPVVASFAGYLPSPQAAGEFRDEDGHITLVGHVEPKVAAPGGTIHLVVTARLAPNRHVYGWAASDPNKISKPALIVLRKTSGWRHGKPQASVEPKAVESGLPEEPIQYYHEDTVSWTVPLQVPKDAVAGQYELAGAIGFQTCTPTNCDPPRGVDFQVQVAVSPQPVRGTIPLELTPTSYAKVAQDAAVAADALSHKAGGTAGAASMDWSDKSLVAVLGLAFLAGLILNVMPCVLPVIGLKIMAFVQQAGGSRREILSLNLWFSLGLLTVFWILAAAAIFAGYSWAEHFGSVRFMVTMIGIVFAFGLSFLGVWEIPIPGFVGSSAVQNAAEREGAIGAYSKGVLSTVLATPCAGPLLVPTVSWAIGQPAGLTWLVFTCIGLGMASPYLLIGAFPRLIEFLPKPGLWMETFKQLMGFLLIGTAIFLFNSLEHKYAVPTLTLLLGIGIGCWWLGRTPMTAALPIRLLGWGKALATIAVAAVIGFLVLVPRHELPWIPYSRAVLDQHLVEGRTVLVDFTADWCMTCKTNEAVALNRTEVARRIGQLNAVALKADKTHADPEIDKLLVELGNAGRVIPFYAVFPAGGGEPITLGGLVSQRQVLDALEQAGR
ncbi:MAG: hypothetical protein GXY58_13310 [Planctomycetaceae bacterium]|nr:hypothetical protein [Planctomycetaceae bacterium]